MSGLFLSSLSQSVLQDRPIPAAHLRIADALAAFIVGLGTNEGKSLARLYCDHPDKFGAVPVVCAITRLSECDDIEVASCVTPGSVVIPVVLGHAQGRDGSSVERAIASGYQVGLAIGRAIGGAFALPKAWPTLLAAPAMAAATIGCLKNFDQPRLLDALAIALAAWNGKGGRPAGSPSARWITFADAVQKGIAAAHATAGGFRGDPAIGDELFGRAELRNLPQTDDTGYKPFPIARQAATAVEAFQNVLAQGVDPASMESITAFVPQINIALLSRPIELHDRSSLLCNLGFQLACAAFAPDLLYDAERRGATTALIEFAKRVTITPGDEASDPRRWPVRLHVRAGGTEYVQNVDELSVNSPDLRESLLQQKWQRLLKPDDRRDFFEHVVPAATGSHAMLWEWIKQRLAAAVRAER